MSERKPLLRLAERHGLTPAFHDGMGKARCAPDETILAVLRLLGCPIERAGDAEAWLEEARLPAEEAVPPVVVGWSGKESRVWLRVHDPRARLVLEDGSERGLAVDDQDDAPSAFLPADLPWGYHRLHVEHSEGRHEARVIVAPTEAYQPAGRHWGVFLPLYSLHSESGYGWGDFGELERLIRWVASKGGSVVGSTPLLAEFLDEPFAPCPYAAASRLFWNEFHVQVDGVPELERCPEARALLGSPAYRDVLMRLREAGQVEYREGMALKRQVLELMAAALRETQGARRDALHAYLRDHPHLFEYARFRAVTEQMRSGWPAWPQRLRDGHVEETDYDTRVLDYHIYVQWLADEQLARVGRAAREEGLGLYLDFPVGTHPDSYDVWKHRELFVEGFSLGAPPDPLFSGGQDWGFPPPHPRAQRRDGYRYLAECLEQHLKHAGVLRLDHVMAFHRLYWVPHGGSAKEGLYVNYPAEEVYAILCLESHRSRTLLLGEDLGTVPEEVREAMERHGLLRMHVGQFSFAPRGDRFFTPPPAASVTSMNTHDTPTFAGFWKGSDLETFGEIGALDEDEVERQLGERVDLRETLSEIVDGERDEVMKAAHEELAASAARVMIVNLEDLWGEELPQNVPGTSYERPNWRRKAALSLEELLDDIDVDEQLDTIDKLRRSR